jgi:hypothetical protein
MPLREEGLHHGGPEVAEKTKKSMIFGKLRKRRRQGMEEEGNLS